MDDKGKPPAIVMHLADLDAFERAVYLRKGEARIPENDAALKSLLDVLYNLSQGAGLAGYPIPTRGLWARLAAAITALVTDTGFHLTQRAFDCVAAQRAVLEAVYRASSFEGSDYVFGLLPEDHEGVNKYLLLFAMDSKLKLDLIEIFTRSPQETVGLYLSMLGYGQCLSPESDARRTALVDICDAFEGVTLQPELLNALCAAYMHVSYSNAPRKHEPKRVFHHLMAGMLGAKVGQLAPRTLGRIRPTILIIFDWWWSKHAMYRCYAPSIRQLKKRFRLIGMARNGVTNEESRAMFDEWVDVEAEHGVILANVIEKITAAAPDIIYYPSIGMSSLTIAMASLRLAPIQVMTYGHPATSNSPVIDYGIIEEDVAVRTRFSEHLITLPAGTVRFAPYAPVTARHQPRAKPAAIKIAISAMQVKIGWPFVQALQEIQRRATVPVEFHFYSACNGVGLYSFAAAIAEQLQNTMVYEKADYAELMDWIAGCDICLFSFPFGGANSLIDALLLGIPVVSLEGEEPHSRTDSTLMRRAGLSERFIAKSVAEYVEVVLDLVENDHRRRRLSDEIKHIDVPDKFFGVDRSDAFLNAFWSIYTRNSVERAA